jgi:hypothetical protein
MSYVNNNLVLQILFLEHNFVKFCKHAKGLNIYDAEKQIIYIY